MRQVRLRRFFFVVLAGFGTQDFHTEFRLGRHGCESCGDTEALKVIIRQRWSFCFDVSSFGGTDALIGLRQFVIFPPVGVSGGNFVMDTAEEFHTSLLPFLSEVPLDTGVYFGESGNRVIDAGYLFRVDIHVVTIITMSSLSSSLLLGGVNEALDIGTIGADGTGTEHILLDERGDAISDSEATAELNDGGKGQTGLVFGGEVPFTTDMAEGGLAVMILTVFFGSRSDGLGFGVIHIVFIIG